VGTQQKTVASPPALYRQMEASAGPSGGGVALVAMEIGISFFIAAVTSCTYGQVSKNLGEIAAGFQFLR
jgi:hypothetical protein